MNTVLVTGATGCVGSNLILHLLRRGYRVKAFHRPTSNTITLEGIDVEHCTGDVRDIDSLLAAMHGCDTVFHVAGMVSFWKKKRKEQIAINVEGTRNVVASCLKLGIAKLIHTSSVAALGYRTDGLLIDETTPYNWGEHRSYKYTKHLAEIEVLGGVKRGLDATIVNPSVIIGPRDVHVHGGQIVRDVHRGRIPAYITGGMNVVSVHDVAVGHIAAALTGRSGERYILGGINLTHKEVFTIAAKVVGGRAPKLRLPVWAVRAVARTCDWFGAIANVQPWITSDLVSGAGMFNWYSIEKAKRELDYTPTSIEDAIRETFEWYLEKKMI